MSYSKYHYVESACSDFFKGTDSSEKFSIPSFALSYLAYEVKASDIKISNKVSNIINSLKKKETIISFLQFYLGRFGAYTLEVFTCVSLEELRDYIINFQMERISYYGDKTSGVISTPWEIAKLATELLEPSENDTFADFCFGTGNFTFTLLENYEVKSLVGYDSRFEQEQIYEIIADVSGFEISANAVDLLSYPQTGSLYNKIFCHCPFCLKMSKNTEVKIRTTLNNNFNSLVKKLRSEYVYIQRVIDNLEENGKAIVFVPLTILSGKDGFIEYLIRNRYLNAVIQFAPNLLQGTNIPFAMVVLSHNNQFIKLIDASEMYTKNRWKNLLSINDINDITAAYFSDKSDKSKKITFEQIETCSFDLNLCNYFYEAKIRINEKDCKYQKLSELCTRSISRGVQYKTEELDSKLSLAPTNIYYLSANCIQGNEVCSDLPVIADIEEKNEIYCLEESDIVLANVNTNPIKVALIKKLGKKKIITGSTIYTIRVNSSLILPEYLKMLLETDIANKVFSVYNSSSSSISSDFLNRLLIPVLPMSKQVEYVSKYTSFQEKIEMLSNGIKSLELEKASLLKSI